MEKVIFSKKDYLWAAGLVLLAFLIRIPNISYPPEPAFDEVHYTNFAIRTLSGEVNIDVHPPFARYLFSEFLKATSFNDLSRKIFLKENYGDFPYIPLRFATVLAGSLLAGIVFLISRRFYDNLVLALIPSWMVIFDGALVSYSRYILPDTYILFFGFLGILLLFHGLEFKNNITKLFLLSAAGLSMGFTASIKWSGLGFLASGLLYLIIYKKIKYGAILIIFCLFGYILPYTILLPEGAITSQPLLIKEMIRGHSKVIEFPGSDGEKITASPILWLFADRQFILWGNGKDDIVKLSPNLFGWTAVIVSIITSFFFAIRTRSRQTFFILTSYFLNYLPFFLVSRSLYMYLYFPALIFGYLLIPETFKIVSDILSPGNIKKPAIIICCLTLLFFLIFIPFIY